MSDTHKSDPHTSRHDHGPKESVGAIFGSREEARHAVAALHKAHFLKSWIGVTSVATDSAGDQTLTAESASGLTLAPKSMGLVDALVAHGIEGDVARKIESEIEPGEALVTVETENRNREEAVEILQRFGGHTELSGSRRSGNTATTSGERRPMESVRGDVAEMPDYREEIFFVRSQR